MTSHDTPPARKKLLPHRRTTAAAMNAVQTIFEEAGCVFQRVAQENDLGKDAYVDLSHNDYATGELLAVQVKGGRSYFRGGRWIIPASKADLSLWRDSSIPVFGIVHDPQARILRWVDLTHAARLASAQMPRDQFQVLVDDGYGGQAVVVPKEQVLTSASMEAFVTAAQRALRRHGGQALLNLVDRDERSTLAAIWEAFALGRSDARALILLRNVLPRLRGRAFEDALWALSHVTLNPDIWWSAKNWIPEGIKAQVLRELAWLPDEIYVLVDTLGEGDWRRGTAGEPLYLLLACDFDIDSKLMMTLERACTYHNGRVAGRVLGALQYRAEDDALALVEDVIAALPQLLDFPYVVDIVAAVREHGWLDIA